MNMPMQNKSALLTAASATMCVTPRPEIVFERGKGDWLFDTEGKKYLDWVQGWAVNCLGHSHSELVATVSTQAERMFNCSPAYYNPPMIELAHKLASKSFADQVFFTNSGAEANEGAVKLARKWGARNRNGAYEIITFTNGFHGRTLSMMAASGKSEWELLFEPKTPGFKKARYNEIDSVRRLIGDKTVAVMLELIQGEAGVIPAELGFVSSLRKLCDEQNILLIIDEVQTGIGRTGVFFAYEEFGVKPDILTLGKGLGGGVPIAALLARSEVCCFEPGDQGGTYNGNPLVSAVGSKVVDIVSSRNFLAEVRNKSAYFIDQLHSLKGRYGHTTIRGQGLLLAMELGMPIAKSIVSRAFNAGLLLNAPRDNVLRFMPALTIEKESIDHGISVLHQIMSSDT